MYVGISSAGRFHTFDLACNIALLGVPITLYTGDPRILLKGGSGVRVKTFPWIMSMVEIARQSKSNRMERELSWLAIESFDTWVSAHLRACDVFHCLSSFGLRSYRAAREKFNAITVCDRASTHIQFQARILAEEFDRWGLPPYEVDGRIIEKEILEYETCDVIIVPSAFAKKTFITLGTDAQKVFAVPFGVNTEIFSPKMKEDLMFRVLYLGTISVRKGIPYLFDALSTVDLRDFELRLVGTIRPEARSFLKGHETRYRYFGPQPQRRLAWHFSQGSVLVLPSIEEGLATVLLQAMACGVPIIASENSGAPDLITNGVEGFVVPPRDSRAIREKVVYLYDHPDERERMARAALHRVSSKHTWKQYAQKVIGIYRGQGGGAERDSPESPAC